MSDVAVFLLRGASWSHPAEEFSTSLVFAFPVFILK